ncbi:MAG: choice-of-anchor D domain-containing protein [Oligoflexia bacterium]|nr:choice-of-anchor D domain-containing protein [Oligoflexia bacterium]
MELSSETIDFGEVIVGNQSTIGILVKNTGDGPLTIDSADLDGTTSADFTFMDLTSFTIDKGEEAELSVRYVPDIVGQDYGRVQLGTNDPSAAIANIDLAGFGVEPAIDLDPDVLWFGKVAAGDSASLSVTVSAQGTGTLTLSDIAVPDDLTGVYTWTLPSAVGLPYDLPAGVSVDLVVTFSPTSTSETNGELTLTSDDPHSHEASVQLLGNSADDPTGNASPVVSLTDPDWGDYFLTDDTVTIQGVAYDEEDDPTSLVCLAYAGLIPIGTGSPDSSGNISIDSTGLPVGDVNVLLRCLDTQGSIGEDSVDVVVWDPADPIEYVLSGGDTLYDWWEVDDDINIYLDDVLVYADTNHTQDTHPPVTLTAELGQEIRVVVTDYNYCDTSLSALQLHFGMSNRQSGVDGFCYSACPDHDCYDPDYAGPWPGVVYEDSFTISIP